MLAVAPRTRQAQPEVVAVPPPVPYFTTQVIAREFDVDDPLSYLEDVKVTHPVSRVTVQFDLALTPKTDGTEDAVLPYFLSLPEVAVDPVCYSITTANRSSAPVDVWYASPKTFMGQMRINVLDANQNQAVATQSGALALRLTFAK